jgi:hypothetical protein
VLRTSPPGAARLVWKQDRAVPPTCASDPFFSEAASIEARAKPCTPASDRTPGAKYAFNPEASCTASSCEQKLLGGGDYAVAWGTHSTDSSTFIMTVADSMAFNRHGSFIPKNQTALAEATALVARIAEAPLVPLLDQHKKWWHEYWPVHHISIPDTVLEQYVVLYHPVLQARERHTLRRRRQLLCVRSQRPMAGGLGNLGRLPLGLEHAGLRRVKRL